MTVFVYLEFEGHLISDILLFVRSVLNLDFFINDNLTSFYILKQGWNDAHVKEQHLFFFVALNF